MKLIEFNCLCFEDEIIEFEMKICIKWIERMAKHELPSRPPRHTTESVPHFTCRHIIVW